MNSQPFSMCGEGYEFTSVNKKIDLLYPPCLPASKIVGEMLKLEDSKEVFRFMVDEVEVTFSLNELRTVMKLPLATANNNAEFVKPLDLKAVLHKESTLTVVDTDYVILIWEVHLDIPKRTNEVNHYVANDEVVQSIFNSRKIDFPMTQSQPTKSSQGTNRTISAPRSPNPQEQQSSESSAPKKPIIIRIPKRKQPGLETLIPTSEQINVANFDKATQLDEDVEMLVEGEDSVADKFANEMMLSQDDPGTRINPGSYKESPEAEKVDEYVFVDEEIEAKIAETELIQRKGKGSLENIDTPLASPTRSSRTESLSSDKDKLLELMAYKPSSSLSKPTSDRIRHLREAITRTSRRQGYMLQHMKKSPMPRFDMNTLAKKFEVTLKEAVPKMLNQTTNQNMKDNLPLLVVEGIKLQREKTKVDIASMVANVVRKEQ
ncbi:hypothetical protein Tco_0734499 [Tanacetum coccineum]